MRIERGGNARRNGYSVAATLIDIATGGVELQQQTACSGPVLVDTGATLAAWSEELRMMIFGTSSNVKGTRQHEDAVTLILWLVNPGLSVTGLPSLLCALCPEGLLVMLLHLSGYDSRQR
jgi:hypothetical protein